MTITAIKQQIKNADRASIYIDAKYSFSLTIDQLVREKLKVGQTLDDSRLSYLKKMSAEGKLRARALAWVLGRPHSTKELRDYLKRKVAEEDFINILVEDFTQKSYINDVAFAKFWVQYRRQSKNFSARRITLELRQKGVDQSIISAALLEEPIDDPTTLYNLYQKKRKLSRYQDQKKLIRYLLGQGYSYDSIKVLLEAED